MRNLILVFAAVAAMRCFGIAASQAWVSNYVAQAISGSKAEVMANVDVADTNGVVRIVSGDVTLTYEEATDAAMLATNCTAAAIAQGVTNGCTFVWNGAGAYVNPHGTIAATPTNLVFSGIASVSTNGVERFAGWFDAYGALIQPHTSLSITNGMTEVTQ